MIFALLTVFNIAGSPSYVEEPCRCSAASASLLGHNGDACCKHDSKKTTANVAEGFAVYKFCPSLVALSLTVNGVKVSRGKKFFYLLIYR